MKIWLVKISERVPVDSTVRKSRTAMLADCLAGRGHEVLWWGSTFDHFLKKSVFEADTELQLNKNYRARLLHGIDYKKNISLRRYIDHKIIAYKFRHLIKNMSPPQLIVASMPTYDLAYEAFNFSKKSNIPIVIDVRDLWPDIFLQQFNGFNKFIVKIVFCVIIQICKYFHNI